MNYGCRSIEEDIRAIAGEFLEFAVVAQRVVGVVVAPGVGSITDAAAAEGERFVKAAILGAIGEIVAEVPLAEDTGAVAAGREELPERDLALAQQRSAHDRVPDSRARGVAPGHDGRARGRTGRIDVEVGQADALLVEFVEVWRPEQRVAVTGQIAVALVVGEDEDHVGALGARLWLRAGQTIRGNGERDNGETAKLTIKRVMTVVPYFFVRGTSTTSNRLGSLPTAMRATTSRLTASTAVRPSERTG